MTTTHTSTPCFTGIGVSTSIFTAYGIILFRANTGLRCNSKAEISNIEDEPCHLVTGNRLTESMIFQGEWLMSTPDLFRPFQKLPLSEAAHFNHLQPHVSTQIFCFMFE